MPVRNEWRYHDAQKNVVERLLREWIPPAVPCATPTTSFLKKRTGLSLPSLHPDLSYTKPIKVDQIQQCRLCASYNLQLNELHLFMSSKKKQSGENKADPSEKPGQCGVFASHPNIKGWEKRDCLKIPQVHAVLLRYGGPESAHAETSVFIKTSSNIKPFYKVNAQKINSSPKAFYIEMPPSRLRVGNLEPKKYVTQRKKKEIFKL